MSFRGEPMPLALGLQSWRAMTKARMHLGFDYSYTHMGSR
jgi:hypothetical protein